MAEKYNGLVEKMEAEQIKTAKSKIQNTEGHMIYNSENGTCIDKIEIKNIKNYILELNGSSNSYASLEKENGSYIQVGGGSTEFTVEVREYEDDGRFTHRKAQRIGDRNSEKRSIVISGSNVTVTNNQVLDTNEVIVLFQQYMNGSPFPKNVDWIDITGMFD
jgi:hypothetical protein